MNHLQRFAARLFRIPVVLPPPPPPLCPLRLLEDELERLYAYGTAFSTIEDRVAEIHAFLIEAARQKLKLPAPVRETNPQVDSRTAEE